MDDLNTITVELSKEEAQFLHDFLGNVVIGHPSSSRRHSDNVITKLEDKGIRYGDDHDFCKLVKKVEYIEFIA